MLRAWASAEPAAERETWCRRPPGKPAPKWRWRRNASSCETSGCQNPRSARTSRSVRMRAITSRENPGPGSAVASARRNRRGVSATCSRASRQPAQVFKCSDSRMRIGAANFARDGILEERLRTPDKPRFYIRTSIVFNSSFQPLLNCVPVSYRDPSDGDTHPLSGSAHGTVELSPYSR